MSRSNHSRRRQRSQGFHRILAIMKKETIQRLRDVRTLALVLSIPLIELFLFAYAVDLTADHLPTALADLSLDNQSLAFVDALEASGYFDVQYHLPSEAALVQAIDEGKVRAGLLIPPDFGAQIEAGTAQALLILDGSDSFSVQAGYSAATAVAQAFSLDLLIEKVERMGAKLETVPIQITSRVLYNPEQDDLTFVMPALVAMLLQLLAVNATAQTIVREYELGTMEQILATPVRPLELLIGKLIPNVGLVVLDQIILTAMGVLWFGVPFRGSLGLFAWLSLIFILACLALGLLISSVAKTQKETQELAGLLMMLSQLLTGFIYPTAPMPPVVRAIGELIPLTYFIRIARGIITKGVGLQLLWKDVIALIFCAAVVTVLAAVTFRRRLD